MKEIWLPIKGFEDSYLVSNLGNIKRKDTGYILKNLTTNRGYNLATLCVNSKAHRFSTHRLVASAFLSNPENKTQVNHKNGIKTDNRVVNLEWCTPKENIRHAFDKGLISRPKGLKSLQSKLTEEQLSDIRVLLDLKTRQEDIAKKYNISQSAVSQIKTGVTYKSE